jgi:hypothetical protein
MIKSIIIINNIFLLLMIISNYRCDSNTQQNRSLTKFSLKKGKRKTVKTVVDRFYRLGW